MMLLDDKVLKGDIEDMNVFNSVTQLSTSMGKKLYTVRPVDFVGLWKIIVGWQKVIVGY